MLVPSWESHSVFTKYVRHYEDIFHASAGRLQDCKVHGNDLIWMGCQKVPHKAVHDWPRVLCDLTPLIFPDPLLYVRAHPWPVAALLYQFRRSVNPLVAVFLVELPQRLLL